MFDKRIIRIIEFALSCGMLLIALLLTIFMFRELYYLALLVTTHETAATFASVAEVVLAFFLYFELISLVVDYFRVGHKIPLHNFIYVGITAMVRLLIAQHDDRLGILMLSGAILILVISLQVLDFRPSKRP
ncbi:phosphate-starvation-inducible protein PsiE [Furfurilactobacillus curtus]|uniref:Protein PsiE n=1 Tax=Furfurilactobacillus curtus TaxID=1746200 RepID=A0ABQ5JRB0_9LACO